MGSPLSAKRHSNYYIETLVFQVEDTVFRIPTRYLCEKSEILRAASEISATSSEGSSDTNPIKLPLPDDGNAGDFASFARVIYALTVDLPLPTDLSKDQWISVLKLSTCWMLDEVRQHAITNISRISPASSFKDKVLLGRRYKVKDWVLEGFTGISSPSNPLLPLNELESLGEGTAIRLLYARQSHDSTCSKTQADVDRHHSRYCSSRSSNVSSGYCNYCGNFSCQNCGRLVSAHLTTRGQSVNDLFSGELDLLSDWK
ncbi:hypothetical protein AAF712_000306 [Marasmius tenuissimus]|uniref:BTB domain-containing protein n=1 Tax=Marasmius tenuissimus TaxID=585030 RepID=A0ABR3AHR4_9AGAR|nr:hypothetical protein PM082_001095 [Marasmius tenuissimus]